MLEHYNTLYDSFHIHARAATLVLDASRPGGDLLHVGAGRDSGRVPARTQSAGEFFYPGILHVGGGYRLGCAEEAPRRSRDMGGGWHHGCLSDGVDEDRVYGGAHTLVLVWFGSRPHIPGAQRAAA